MYDYRLSLADLSRFVSDDSIHLHVRFDLGDGDLISCSGIILANASKFLETAVKSSDTLKLPGFTHNGSVDCVKMVHGGRVLMSKDNFADILKFGVFFKVPWFHDECLDWVGTVEDVDVLLNITRVVLGNTDLMEYCGEKHGKRSEKKKPLSICWRNESDTNPILRECRLKLVSTQYMSDAVAILLNDGANLPDTLMRFLLDLNTLSSLLPVLQVWISSLGRVNMMLECVGCLIETQRREVILHTEAVSEVLEMMDRLSDLPRETTQRIRKLEGTLMKQLMSQMIKRVDITPVTLLEALNSKVWRTHDKSQLLALRDSLKLPEHLFLDIFLDWLSNTNPPPNDILELWGAIKQSYVSAAQVKHLRNLITSKFDIPLVEGAPQSLRYTAVNYKCKQDLVKQLCAGKSVNFSFPAPSTSQSYNSGYCCKLKLREERDEITGLSYETECEGGLKVIHWFITFQEGLSFWTLLDRQAGKGGTVYLSLFVNDFQDIFSVLQRCNKNLEVWALLDG